MITMESPISSIRLKFDRTLTPKYLEEELKRYETAPGLSVPRPPVKQLIIDLSSVEWSDLGAVAQLTLIVQRYAADPIHIMVLLPSRSTETGDSCTNADPPQIRALRFLEYLRFPDCLLELRALTPATISVTLDGHEWKRETAPDNGNTYNCVVPLLWIRLEDDASRDKYARHIVTAAENAGMGLDAFDARSLSNVVLYELIENVANHATSSSVALICGMAHRQLNLQRVGEFLPDERPYLDFLNQNGQVFIEILVGDAGDGIVHTLDKAYRSIEGAGKGNLTRNGLSLPYRVVRWAFDRWSSGTPDTPDRRGVRGLFRVDRIAAKYQGLISVRTHRTLFVRDHSYLDEVQERYRKEPKAFAHFDGTLVRVRLIPRVVAKLRLAQTVEPLPVYSNQNDTRLLPAIKMVPIGELTEEGIAEKDRNRILETISTAYSRPDYLFVFFANISHASKFSVERALEFLATHASPVPIFVLNLGGSDEELALAVTSVNAQLERANHSAGAGASPRESRDLIGVLSASGKLFWAGVAQALADKLELVSEAGWDSKSPPLLSSLEIPPRTSAFFTLRHISHNPVLMRLTHKLDRAAFLQPFTDELSQCINANKPDKGIQSGNVYLTPTLRYVSTWLDIERLIDKLSVASVDGFIFALSLKLLHEFGPLSEVALLSTPSSSAQLRSGLVRSLELSHEIEPYIVYSETPDLSIIRSGKEIIVYSDIVSSEEAARRAIQFARNHGLHVRVVACLLDTRKEQSRTIRVLGEDIRLVSLLWYVTETPARSEYLAISPSLRWIEKNLQEDQWAFKTDPLLEDPTTLRFGHIKRPNGRHLTLTVDVENLLSAPALIEFVHDRITSFHAKSRPFDDRQRPVAIWVPIDKFDDEKRKNAIIQLFKNALPSNDYIVFIRPKISLNGVAMFDQNNMWFDSTKFDCLVIFDWGTISGSTIHDLIEHGIQMGATNVSVLVASTQLPSHEVKFIKSTSKLSVRRLTPGADLLAEQNVVEYEVPIEYAHFSALSLGQFSAHECPVCSQLHELSRIPPSVKFLDDYVSGEIARLDKFHQLKIAESNQDQRRRWIGRMRHGLTQAPTSTLIRKYILEEIVTIAESDLKQGTARDCAIALIELLYLEGQWLKTAPLQFKVCRHPIADICERLIKASDGKLQRMAISVLRRTSKTAFINKSAIIFETLTMNTHAQQALLSGLHSYITRDYHQSASLTAIASAAINRIRDFVMNKDQQSLPAFVECRVAISYLQMQANFLRARADSSVKSRVRLMIQLKDILLTEYTPHGAPATASTNLTSRAFDDAIKNICLNRSPNESDVDDVIDQIKSKRRNWHTCQTFLLSSVVPLLVNLENEFASSNFRMCCEHPEDAFWLRQLIAKHKTGLAPINLSSMLTLIEPITKSTPNPHEVETAMHALQEFRTEVDFLGRCLLRAQKFRIESETEIEKASIVSQFLAQFPADIEDAISSAHRDVPEVRIVYESPMNLRGGARAYCPKELLTRTIAEIFKNVEKYGSRPEVTVLAFEQEGLIDILFSNPTDSRHEVSFEERHGLRQCASELNSFDAELDPKHRPGLQFAVHLRLKKWE